MRLSGIVWEFDFSSIGRFKPLKNVVLRIFGGFVFGFRMPAVSLFRDCGGFVFDFSRETSN